MKTILLAVIFLMKVFSLSAQITFSNPGFEGPPLTATCPPLWDSCGEYNPDTNPNDTNSFWLKVYIPAFAGHTYVGISSSKISNVQNSVGQKLPCNLVKDKTHHLSLYAYHISYSLFQYGNLEFWAGNQPCSKDTLLWSGSITDTFWTRYDVSFTPDNDYDYILFTNSPCDTCQQVYIGIDSLSEITVDGYNLLSVPFSDTIINKWSCINLMANSDDTTGHFVWSSIPAGFNANSSTVSVCPTVNTQYVCTITSGCGEQKSDTVNVEVTPNGVKNIAGGEDLSIYPNPVQNQLQLSNLPKQTATLQYTIINTLGQIKQSNTLPPNNTLANINVSALPAGIYFIRLTDNKGFVYSGKFVKE